ncbi:MAG: 6-bladed beta-propeller [Chitinophagales bacterium]|nr:6-bladed beta-propeller [Chitinophagales bacterium]
MKIHAFKFLFAVFCFTMLSSCINKFNETEIKKISITQSNPDTKASDLFYLQGFTPMEFGAGLDWRGISKILFKEDGTMIILNYIGDKQDVWLVDQRSGKTLLKIGEQNIDDNGYEGVNDIILDQGEIKFCVAGKMAFMNYDLGGTLRSCVKTGVFGEEMEKTSAGEYVVYNEYNSTKISGLNHLVFYDKDGNITKRISPYLASQDGNGYDFAGSLTSSEGLWFNPPFCDTVYEIAGNKLHPRYFFDFGQTAMPDNVKNKKLTGWDTNKFSFLSKGFAKIGRFIIFEFYDNQKVRLGIYDESTEQFVGFGDFRQDYLFELLRLGDIFPKDAQSFALQIRPSRLNYLLSKNLIDLAALEYHNPGLTVALKNSAQNNVPLILYVGINANAQVNAPTDQVGSK